MNEFQILVKDHGLDTTNLWIESYKVVNHNKFVLRFVENRQDAGFFDEDDYIIELCKSKFKLIELYPEQEIILPIGIS